MFAGLKVLELASVLAGPGVGQFFAELGASVTKVEHPDGDVTRSWKSATEQTDDRSAYFCSCNWGKRSVVLDLRADADYQRLLELVRGADIVIASYKPGDDRKLKADYHTLQSVKKDLIYGSISGYGAGDDRVGYDAVVQAESGFMYLNGEAGGPPVKMPVALIDLMAAHHLKEGLLVALLHKAQTGNGGMVEVSLYDAAIASLANQATNWLVGGKDPGRMGSLHPNIAPYGERFETSDGRELLLAVGSDRQYRDLLEILAIPADHALRSVNFSTNAQRVEHRMTMQGLMGPFFKNLASGPLLKAFHARKIPVGSIRKVSEALSAAPHMILKAGTLRGVRTIAAQMNFMAPGNLSAPPHLGEG